jgi:hypothetical protein
MDEQLCVTVPRNLRVATTVAHTIGNTTIRLRLPVFLWLCSLGLPAMVAVLLGLFTTATVLVGIAVCGWAALEARWWGYGTWEWSHIVLRHLQRPHYLVVEPIMITLPLEEPVVAVSRRPRWQAARTGGSERQ